MSGSPERPLVLLCACAGTMPALDFEALRTRLSARAEVSVHPRWCDREGQARILESLETAPERRLLLAGCSQDFANRKFHATFARGVHLEIADVRESCAWVHEGEPVELVTEKAARIVEAAIEWPEAPASRVGSGVRVDSVLVVGGGVAGTQAAVALAHMGHHVDLVERRPFLGGRAARIGTVFPTNDCGQCLPTTDAQPGTRKCFHRNLSIDHPNLTIWRRTTVGSITGRPGDFAVSLRTLPNVVTEACIACGRCEDVCGATSQEGTAKAIYSEFYDGRVLRTVDLETCTFCGACAQVCPVGAIDLRQSPRLTQVRAGAVLVAVGCQPAPGRFLGQLGYGRKGVLSQTEFTETMDAWEALAAVGRLPAEEVVMIQCAGSRDKRRLRYCSRLCCMIALKHAIRLRTLFPAMRVKVCYLELRTPGFENWYLAARQAGVEFIRGLPPEVQADADGRPVLEVEDMTSGQKRLLRPDLVVLSNGMVSADDAARLARVCGADLDEDGFVRILDGKNRATETTAEGVFVCGSASGPKALVEANTEAWAAASGIHGFLASPGRLSAPASEVDEGRCTGCDTCVAACPFGAVSLAERPAGAPRPASMDIPGRVARIDPRSCHACGICAARCPEMAIRHHLPDQRLSARTHHLTADVPEPIIGFYCKECAGAAISLSGLRRDRYPSDVRLVELGCLGRLNALHIVEAARMGAIGVFLAGCAEGRCQYRAGDRSAAEQARLAREILADSGRPIPIEIWHLCAVDRASVGRRIRMFSAAARGVDDTQEIRADEARRIGIGP